MSPIVEWSCGMYDIHPLIFSFLCSRRISNTLIAQLICFGCPVHGILCFFFGCWNILLAVESIVFFTVVRCAGCMSNAWEEYSLKLSQWTFPIKGQWNVINVTSCLGCDGEPAGASFPLKYKAMFVAFDCLSIPHVAEFSNHLHIDVK